MSTRKPGLQTCWPGFPTIPPAKSPTCCPGIGRRTWSPRPPWLPERSSAEDHAYLGAGREHTDQRAQLRIHLRSPSQWARLPTPVAAKAGPMPTHEHLGPDDRENLQDIRKPAIQLDKAAYAS